jgi:hypothetical protein
MTNTIYEDDNEEEEDDESYGGVDDERRPTVEEYLLSRLFKRTLEALVLAPMPVCTIE